MSNDAQLDAIKSGYTFEGSTVNLGVALSNGEPQPDVHVSLPLAMMNRHGLIAGATGTGKTKTLQVLAEQLSANGVPVFMADVKGDLSGIAAPGESNDKLAARTSALGQTWQGTSYPAEFFTLGGEGTGVPIRATIESFGPILLSRVLDLNSTQESALQLIFHYADQKELELYNLADLRAVIQFLTSAEGKAESWRTWVEYPRRLPVSSCVVWSPLKQTVWTSSLVNLNLIQPSSCVQPPMAAALSAS